MSAPSIARPQNNKIGTCPHGLPMGACPICNGMGGGGGSTRRQPKAGELTWDQCYAIGQMMKAQKANAAHAKEHAAQAAQMQIMQNIADKISALRAAIVNIIPAPITKAFSALKSLLLTPVSQLGQKFVNMIQTALTNIAKAANAVKDTFINITDKLAAVFGEMKNAIEKKISEKFKDLKKKVFNLFGIADVENEEDEEDEEIKKLEESESRVCRPDGQTFSLTIRPKPYDAAVAELTKLTERTNSQREFDRREKQKLI